ncbi:Bacterial alpha-L-rhamnosidase [Streptomyces adustus]|uniref:alpha-L-rhamnosidase n=1 Tax=Streptomyces adustus TaxID=1609272 RepID=A0A5N8V536_9ACTN|nr:family 78 glycoside hydrolase catalytic domain [Streptomyces adustus]MPY30267.1 Bacterial alpha-L-rhamnosidase [Streptomyces adustus]
MSEGALSRRQVVGVGGALAAGMALPLASRQTASADNQNKPTTGGNPGSSEPRALQVNSMTAPLGTQTAPRFGWQPAAALQTAYEVQVGTRAGRSDLWSSGKVKSSNSTEVVYRGKPLASQSDYHWRVRTWDEHGKASDWSESSLWETGLFTEKDWSGAHWIGGRPEQDHDWTDFTETVVFRGGSAPATGLILLFRAEPIGKTWGEALSWTIRRTGTAFELVMTTKHYAGNTWVDDGTTEPDWGVNHYDPQSETNPTAVGTRSVAIATVALPDAAGLTAATWDSQDHTVTVSVTGLTVTTTVNGVEVDTRTLQGDQIRRHGTIGFGANTSATVRSVKVRGSGARDFSADLREGANPFESGIGTTGGLTFVGKNAMLPIANPSALLRKPVSLPRGRIASARLHVSGAGCFTFTVNGRLLTTDGKQPAADGGNVPRLLSDHSTYDRTVLYDTFDVTDSLRAGHENVLAAELGRGWYGLTTPCEWFWNLAPYVGAPRLRAKLVVTYEDRSPVTVTTGPAWQTADGPTLFDSVYSGEKYDARRAAELGDWRLADYRRPGDWQAATVMISPGSCSGPSPEYHGPLPATKVPAGFTAATVRAHEAEPVLVNRTLQAQAINETSPGSGVWVVDFGQIMTGFVTVDFTGLPRSAEGNTVRMRGGNSVTGSGTAASPYVVAEENNFHDANLQTNYYTCSSAAEQRWEPQFGHFGFRYLEVRNVEAVLGRGLSLQRDARLFTVNVARSGFARTGTFTTDNALINRIQSNLEWAEQNNLVQKPTDTPSREKNGWTGDTMASSESQCLTWDVNAALTKYLRSFPDGQISTGQLPMILPAAKGGYGYDRTPGWNFTWKAVPAWDSAYFVIPWELRKYYGNSVLFEELYDHQDALLATYEKLFTADNNYKFTAALGAYSGAESAGSNAVISLAFYVHFCDYMVEIGTLLGRTERASHYKDLARTLRKAFVTNYWNATSNSFDQGSLSSENAMAVAFDLVPGRDLAADDPRYLSGARTVAENEAALAKFCADRIVNADHHIQSDMYGSRYEYNILSDHGYTDVLLKAVTVATAPSYASQIAQGATSLWESWSGGSLNHHYRSLVATWFYQSLAGIRPTSDAYETVRIRPYIPSVPVNSRVPAATADTDLSPATLDRVAASIDTVRGEVASGWSRRPDGRITLKVTVPTNTTAELWVPTQGRSVDAPRGVELLRSDTAGGASYQVYTATAGTYTFNA